MNNDLLPEKSWWNRNWSWALPLGGCLTVLIIIGVVIGSVFFSVTSMLDDSVPLEYALNKINEDPEIIEQMGFPIEKNGMIQGEFNWVNGEKVTDIKVPIAGPEDSGTLFIKASARDDIWTYHEIKVVIKENEALDLLDDEWD
ncbi:cytochrome c oxidase assembly factor Coa1 family protein [uncultured Eudoraea sp.]|uniref:cytochrome c oxidase assembly factor Coa1 family protein n=1 Tax=uncultured Eudoraea sp. TaxID=1035614 RepID=UPI002625162C|nr:cytochrome c oxidase assembly factor Coa1 family protein [uncultured Eudoraea sp.]